MFHFEGYKMNIKHLFLAIFLLIFAGCSRGGMPSTPQISVKSTIPVFITQNSDQNITKTDANATKTLYIKFKNSSGQPNSLEKTIATKLEPLGYIQISQMQKADLVILGDLLSMERYEHRERARPRMFMSMGYGWGRRWSGPSMSMGMMMPFFYDDWDDFDRTEYYVYRGLVSILIQTNGSEQRTNLEVQSERNLYSPSYIMPYIEDKIATQILNFFY